MYSRSILLWKTGRQGGGGAKYVSTYYWQTKGWKFFKLFFIVFALQVLPTIDPYDKRSKDQNNNDVTPNCTQFTGIPRNVLNS